MGGGVSAPRQLDALTGVRGLAAWLVVAFHIRVTLIDTLPGWLLHIGGKGYLAVDLFFILSGFVMWHTYGEKLRGAGISGILGFWWRRFARIWPLHAFVLSVVVALAVVLALTGRDVSAYRFAELPFYYLLIQNWGLVSDLGWNDPAWSISCEMGAYVMFPAVVAVMPWRRLGDAGLMLWGLGLLAAIWVLFRLMSYHTLGQDIPHMGLARCLIEFSLGNVLRLAWARWQGWRWLPVAAWGVFGALVALDLLVADEMAVVPGAFAALVLALASGRGRVVRFFASRPMLYLGEISYSTYLAHFVLFVVFKMLFVHGAGRPHLGLGQLGGFVLIVLAASVALYHGVEKPAQKWLNALARRREALPLAPAE